MNERTIEKIFVHYENGEVKEVEKGAVISFGIDEENYEYSVVFDMLKISGQDLQQLVMSVLELGNRIGMFENLKEV